jgi:membrane-bound lytic murein transglycosylase B
VNLAIFLAAAASALPAPNAPLPVEPAKLAAQLDTADREVRSAIGEWAADGEPRSDRLPADLEAWALRQQRIVRLLSRRPDLAAKVLPRVPAAYRSIVVALRELKRLAGPPVKGAPKIRTGRAQSPARLQNHYRAAFRRFRVGPHVLAAVNFVETAFNKLRNRSTADAQGPMQFIAPTWRAYGLGGDVHDPHDAILGAANYLRANGAPGDYARALYHYNPSPLYVNAVLRYARLIGRDRRWFHTFYAWQVFVRGERRVTGPELAPTR